MGAGISAKLVIFWLCKPNKQFFQKCNFAALLLCIFAKIKSLSRCKALWVYSLLGWPGWVSCNMKFLYFSNNLKITEKVSFNIASEASYVYILSGQKFIKNAKNGPFCRVFENLKLAVPKCYHTGQF